MPFSPFYAQTISHNGLTIAFYLDKGPDDNLNQIYYRVFDPKPGLPSQEDDWDELIELDLGDDYRLVGNSAADASDQNVSYYPYLYALSEAGQIYLFRHIKSGAETEKITVNRLRVFNVPTSQGLDDSLDAEAVTQDPLSSDIADVQVIHRIERVWEARFKKSESRTVPSGDEDSMDFKNVLESPFYEPTLVMTHLPAADNGFFAVDIFTTDDPDQSIWHFYLNQENDKDERGGTAPHDELHIFYVRQSIDGLFDMPVPDLIGESSLKPESRIFFKMPDNGSNQCCTMKFGMTCQRYGYQEKNPGDP